MIGWWLGSFLPTEVVTELSAVGGVILLGLGLGLLDVKKIKLLNFLPALLFAVVLAYAWPYLEQLWQ